MSFFVLFLGFEAVHPKKVSDRWQFEQSNSDSVRLILKKTGQQHDFHCSPGCSTFNEMANINMAR